LTFENLLRRDWRCELWQFLKIAFVSELKIYDSQQDKPCWNYFYSKNGELNNLPKYNRISRKTPDSNVNFINVILKKSET